MRLLFKCILSMQPPSLSSSLTSLSHLILLTHFFNNRPSFPLPSSHSFLRCAVRPRQQGELHRRPRGWHGCVHRLLGQLPQTVELKRLTWRGGEQIWGEEEKEDRKRRSQRQDGRGEIGDKDVSEDGECDWWVGFPLSLSLFLLFVHVCKKMKKKRKQKRLWVRHAV